MNRNYTDTCRRETKVNYTIDYKEYELIKPWGYVGYALLWSVPVVGWICWIISCFSNRNKNVKNYARGQFCMAIFSALMTIIFTVVYAILVEKGLVDPSEAQQAGEAIAALF